MSSTALVGTDPAETVNSPPEMSDRITPVTIGLVLKYGGHDFKSIFEGALA